ncbi:MAG TPA: class A beta-lactamase [Steroidobacteraceae bacterium]|nr:class A beta-lactamase [Steroidobacteraceae bacterium]
MIDRRSFLASALVGASAACGRAVLAVAADRGQPLEVTLRELEDGDRVGIHVIDTATGREFGHRSDERFLMLSSFKTLACALVLHRADAGEETLERRIRYTPADLVSWSPVTEKHVDGPGLTLAELCEATLTTSDNTAANLILSSFGGPPALTAYLRRLGDTVTRLDRTETALNTGHADRLLDTTTPRAMAQTVRTLLLGNALTEASRTRLVRWMQANSTGARRLRSGLPAGWRIAEKTGTSDTGANDVGVLWPPGAAPVVVAAYVAESTAPVVEREAKISAVARLVTGQ